MSEAEIPEQRGEMHTQLMKETPEVVLYFLRG